MPTIGDFTVPVGSGAAACGAPPRRRVGAERRGRERHRVADGGARDADAPVAYGIFDFAEPGFVEQRRQRAHEIRVDGRDLSCRRTSGASEFVAVQQPPQRVERQHIALRAETADDAVARPG